MWETLTTPWKLCLEQSWQAYCSGTIPIGAVIVDEEDKLIASGRNRIFDKSAPIRQVAGSKLAHAEINALLQIPPDDESVGTYRLYTAVEPCPLCCGALYMSGIKEVHYAARDSHAGSTNMYGKTAYLTRKAM
ncbi:MAG: nucleoside deaminase, partial [Bacillota bacterium]|nr:nucleoside deaminase [Bacillota bacterium]